ncbi:MAG: hypothetical protein LBT68_01380 [Spirochaetales bacterium]|jgi:hypothetical protein|nr:hypothetical protein [Spirochaetales bacterium]
MKKIPVKIPACAIFAIWMFVFFAAAGFSEEVLVESFGYYLDIPEGWGLVDAADPAMISFADADKRTVFQVTVFQGKNFASARAAAAFYKAQIKAEGDEADFVYQGKDAVIGDYSFTPGKFAARGWFVFISTGTYHFVLSAFCEASRFEASGDVLLSCVDSFAPDEDSRLYPGPVSQFYQTFPPERSGAARLSFNGETFSLPSAENEAEANTVVIEREARILTSVVGSKIQDAAWQRYYRVIFRDSYMRLLPLAQKLKPLLDKTAKAAGAPAALLSWFQGFSYFRAGGVADFQSPLECVLDSAGDCDSLGMAYIILLRQLGFDAILLVSEKYNHALAAVDVPGEGARFDFEGKRYLIAELTDKVAIGLIGKGMADPAFWLPVALGHPVKD